MDSARQAVTGLVESVLHPTDFSAASERAFAHALAVALLRETRLTLLHVGGARGADPDWTEFPAVRRTLERWGLLEPGSPRSAVFEKLRLRVAKVVIPRRFPARAVLDYLDEDPFDLIVLATEGREGLARWLKGSVAETVARVSKTMTLFVPAGAERDFVALDDGQLTLGSVLIPVDHDPPANDAIALVRRMAAVVGGNARLTLLHVGPADADFPVTAEDGDGASFQYLRRSDGPVEGILKVAALVQADLIVMPTAGRHGVFDALRGSTSEQVLRRAPCPLLAVPSSDTAAAAPRRKPFRP